MSQAHLDNQDKHFHHIRGWAFYLSAPRSMRNKQETLVSSRPDGGARPFHDSPGRGRPLKALCRMLKKASKLPYHFPSRLPCAVMLIPIISDFLQSPGAVTRNSRQWLVLCRVTVILFHQRNILIVYPSQHLNKSIAYNSHLVLVAFKVFLQVCRATSCTYKHRR